MQTVRLFSLAEERPKADDRWSIPVFLGRDVSGRPLVADLTELPHLLIAGQTEGGKTACLDSILVSISEQPPEQVRPVLIDSRKAEAVFDWAVEETERRRHLFTEPGFRGRSPQPSLPTFVIVADNVDDLLTSNGVERSVVELARQRPTVGIHLVLATGLSSVHTLPGCVKTLIPTRIALAVVSKSGSWSLLNRIDTAGQPPPAS